jgi:hypothetical protein
MRRLSDCDNQPNDDDVEDISLFEDDNNFDGDDLLLDK